MRLKTGFLEKLTSGQVRDKAGQDFRVFSFTVSQLDDLLLIDQSSCQVISIVTGQHWEGTK